MHNILQGVSKLDEWISTEEKTTLTDWIQDNAKRYWLSPGGPLRPPEEGGANVIIVSYVVQDPERSVLIESRLMIPRCLA